MHEGATFFLPGTEGANFHETVAPLPDEPVILKHRPNAFLGTTLADELTSRAIDHLVLCGMMTNMCVDATARAAVDMGYAATVIHDACSSANLAHDGVTVEAAQVHAAFVAALAFGYGEALSTAEYLAS